MASFSIFRLPSELILQVLSLLTPPELAISSRICRKLRHYATDDSLWRTHIQANVPGCKVTSPAPCSTFHKLFTSINPFWFLPRAKLWYADGRYTGRLIVVRYSQARQRIEGYSLAAARDRLTAEPWAGSEGVDVMMWEPKIQLDESLERLNLATEAFFSTSYMQRAYAGIEMPAYNNNRHWWHIKFLPASQVIDPAPIPGSIWPPTIIPAKERSRRINQPGDREWLCDGANSSEWRGLLSESTFRTRRWMSYTLDEQGVSGFSSREYETYATLLPELYTPTESKPWRGVYCGDYAGHGCEFILVMQPDDPGPLPLKAADMLASIPVDESQARAWRAMLLDNGAQFVPVALPTTTTPAPGWSSPAEAVSFGEGLQPNDMDAQPESSTAPKKHCLEEESEKAKNNTSKEDSNSEPTSVYQGRLQAIKLTGDFNVPSGEYTFIAPDIGDLGFIRNVDEDQFRGARIVRSVGHIAAEGFFADQYIPSQLILVSHDLIAQYWEAFGHISLYHRVDIDSLIQTD